MKPPTEFVRIVGRKRYDVQTATLIAGDDYWDGHNWERRGRNTWLYKTPRGAFFMVTLTQWGGEQESLIPITEDHATGLYEGILSEHRIEYSEAFPGVEIEDA